MPPGQMEWNITWVHEILLGRPSPARRVALVNAPKSDDIGQHDCSESMSNINGVSLKTQTIKIVYIRIRYLIAAK